MSFSQVYPVTVKLAALSNIPVNETHTHQIRMFESDACPGPVHPGPKGRLEWIGKRRLISSVMT